MLQGYYSLIQYCPDWTRLEVCNIGVLLYCPQRQFLDVKMSRKIAGRIRKFFGQDHSLDHFQIFREIFAQRILAEKDRISELDDLKRFIAGCANSFLITEPRSIAVDDPEQELCDLFTEVFGESPKQEKAKRVPAKKRFYEALEKKLGASLDERVKRDLPAIEVPIPGFHETIRPCAGFLNGSFNLIVERRLTTENSFKRMSSDMIIGRFLYEKEDEHWGKRSLIILADADNTTEVNERIKTFTPMMQEYKTAIFVDPMEVVTMIKEEAKVLST